jgi:hypothetical protein
MKAKNTNWLPLILASAATLVLTGCWSLPSANVQPKGQPGLIQADIPVEVIQNPVTVEALDATQRTITLKRDDGTTKVFTIGESVKNLDWIKVGDKVKATVKAELSVYVLENGQLPKADGTTQPKTINFNAKVLLVDASYRLLTLQFTDGYQMTIKTGMDAQLLKMEPGDDVVMRSGEVTAISVK